MKKIIILIALLSFSFGAFEHLIKKDTHESLIKEMITLSNDMVVVLESITDEATAQTAAHKLRDISRKGNALQDRMTKLGEPTPDEEEQLKEKYQKELEGMSTRLMDVMMGLMDKPYAAEALKAMQ